MATAMALGNSSALTSSRPGRILAQPLAFSRSIRCMHSRNVVRLAVSSKQEHATKAVDIDQWNDEIYSSRLKHLETQAMDALTRTIECFKSPTFPCALILGDVVLLDLLDKAGALSNETVKVVFIDTFHLFPETYDFLKAVEERYKFKARIFQADGFRDREQYIAKHGSDLYIRNVEEYDKICKVEPFNRALATLQVDAMINGRRRDHGAERAHLEVAERGKMVNVQPLAYWEFRDCWNYLTRNKIPYHPLHDKGYPSVGDVQSTLPVARDKWFEYGTERSGRFQGMTNLDGSLKRECGIHSQK